jgi:TPR repeat protein
MAIRYLGVLLILVFSTAFAGSSSHRPGGTSIYFTQLGHLKHQAELGDPNAQFLLGNLYLAPPEGSSIQQNLDKAVDYYFQAAIRNHAGAQYNLGVLYYRGSGVPESKMMASVWFTLAANNTGLGAKNVKRNAQKSLDDLKAVMADEEKVQAVEWIKTFSTIIESKNYRLARLPKLG